MTSQSTSRETDRPETANAPSQYVELDISALRVGMRLTQDLYDQDGVLLIAGGSCVTSRLMNNLRERGSIIKVCARPAAGDSPAAGDTILETEYTRNIDTLLEAQLGDSGREHIIISSLERKRPRLPTGELFDCASGGLQAHGNATHDFADICKTLKGGGKANRDGIASIMNNFMNMIAIDADLLPLVVSMQKTPDEYLFNHCVNVAMISMTIADQLGMMPAEVMEIGIGGLLADVGMLQVPEHIRLADRPLTSDERIEILRHPAYTLDFLERIKGLPLPVKFIGYQAHERMDASGYPRKRSGMLIHRYAKIVSVADSYAAMTGHRPHRPSLQPYQAARQILVENSRSKFDRDIVRAFLDCMSLFPVGSHVELSDGRWARVLRATPGQHTKPVVLELDAEGNPTNIHIDLAEESNLAVVNTAAEIP